MKHGISFEMVDLHRQEPNRNVRESKYFWDELYTLVSASGFQYIEIPYEPKWDFGGRSGVPLTNRSIAVKFQDPQNYLTVLNQSGIKGMIGVHLDPSIFLSENLAMFFGASHHYGKEAIDFASKIGAEYLTFTATPAIGALQAVCPEDTSWEDFSKAFLKKTTDTINELADYADIKGIKFCLKNEYWTLLRGKEILSFVKSLKTKVLLDIDTANLKIAGVDSVAMISENADLIGCVHFTDTSFVDDAEYYKQSMPEFPAGHATQVFRDIGQGEVDFPKILAALKKIKYDGAIVFNCRQTRDIYRALLRTRYYINNKLAGKQ
jgi:inosose dehydratase